MRAGIWKLDEGVNLGDSPRQLLQDFLPQLLRLAKEFLIFDEQPVHLERVFRREALAQNHVAHPDRIWKDGFFGEFFEGCRRIVVIHGEIVMQWAVVGGQWSVNPES